MSSLRKKFGTNKESIQEGAWIDILENEDGSVCRFRIKRMNQQNTAFQKQLANHRKAFESDNYSERRIGQMQASMIEILINTVIVDWENVEDWTIVDQKPSEPGFAAKPKFMPFSHDNCRKMLLEFPDLLDLITREAQELSNFQDELKN